MSGAVVTCTLAQALARLGALGEDVDGFLDRVLALTRELTGAAWAAVHVQVTDEVETVEHQRGALDVPSANRIPFQFEVGRGWLGVAGYAGSAVRAQDAEVEAFAVGLGAVLGQGLLARSMRTARTMYRTLVEQLPAVIYYRDIDTPGRPWFVSPQMEALTGYQPTQWANDPSMWVRLLHPEDRVWILPDQAAFAPEEMTKPLHRQYRIIHRDGHIVWVENTVLAVRDEVGKVRLVMGLLFDVTERKTLEAGLREAQKVEAIGKLAGGVAHDFNNLLAVMLGWVEDLKAGISEDDGRAGALAEIERAALRARDLTGKLLAFGRRQLLDLKPTRLDALVGGFESTLVQLAGEGVRVSLRLAEVEPVRVDAGQIEQVLLNLVANARDAMPAGGHIEISVYSAERTLGAERVVCVAVRDDGVGLDEATRARIFDPFFTTKERTINTGLGLSTALGIVQQCAGRIEVQSAPGHGATFTVVLPVSPDFVASALAEVREPVRGKAVVVVEPDDQIRRLVVMLLGRLGHHAWEASEAASALERLDDGAEIVICDASPTSELAQRVRERAPHVALVLLSDLTDLGVVRLATRLGARVLRKPFTLRALAAALEP